MTRNSAFKQQVRARAARTGENYTTARRMLLRERETGSQARSSQVEPHYRLIHPDVIEYVDQHGQRRLPVPPKAQPPFTWGSAGDEPLASADAILIDATGSTDHDLAVAFIVANLSWKRLAGRSFALTAAEVRAWRRENEPSIRAEAAEEGTDWLRRVLDDVWVAPLRKPWWEQYRERHGRPQVGKIPGEKMLIHEALEIVSASGPPRLGGPGIPLSPEQSMVYVIYTAATGVNTGYGRRGALERYQRTARSVGISQDEIDAAREAANSSSTPA